MEKFFTLTFELQAVLVCGYIGYSIASIGYKSSHTIEDRILQIVTYGFLGLLAHNTLFWALHLIPKFNEFIQPSADSEEMISIGRTVKFFLMLIVSIVAAAIWKTKGKRFANKTLKRFKVTNEDHYPTAIASIMHGHNEIQWKYINLFLVDGRTIQSDMSKIYSLNPIGDIPLIDDHGSVALYVTSIFKKESVGTVQTEHDPKNANGSWKLNYYPKDQIKGIEICWELATQ